MAHKTADTQSRFIRTQVIYPLKRRYGVPATLFRLDSKIDNIQTGKVQKSYTRVRITRVAALPQNTLRKFIYDLSFIAANKNFTYGGFFDHMQKVLLVDGKDLPANFEIDPNDHFELEGIRYSIKKLELFEHDNKAWVVGLSRVKGEPPTIIVRASVSHVLEFTQDPSVVVIP